MTPKDFLAGHITRAVGGPVWHGDALSQILSDVTAAEAGARPIPGAHNIAELVAHISVWAAIVERRLAGENASATDEENFPTLSQPTDERWSSTLELLRERHASLSRAIARLDATALNEPVAFRDYSAAYMIHGVVEHDAYHAGQISLLKKMVRLASA